MDGNAAYKLETSDESEKLFDSRIVGNASAPDVPPNLKPSGEREWLTTDEAAHFLGISPASLRNLCSNGKIPYYKWQRRNRYKTDELRNLLTATKRGGSYGY